MPGAPIMNPVVGEMYPCSNKCSSCHGGAPEVESLRFAKACVSSGMTVLDIGAHAGMYSVALSPIVGPYGKIHAIEASPNPFNALLRNAGLYPHIEPHNIAAWNKSDTVEIDIDHSTAGHYISLPDNHEVFDTQILHEVKAFALHDYFPFTFTVDFVKLDIEGAEYHALQGMEDILQRSPNVGLILEINIIAAKAWGVKVEDIFDFLENLGFHPTGKTSRDFWVNCMDDNVGGNLHFLKESD